MKKFFKWSALTVGGLFALFGVICLVAAIFEDEEAAAYESETCTVEQFRTYVEREINRELVKKDHPIAKRIESAHGTVTVKRLYVSDVQVETKDGSNIVGAEGKNIRSFSVAITSIWDGVFHKDGRTVLGILFEDVNGKIEVTKAQIIATDAMVNMEDPDFWYNVGFGIGTLLAL